MCDFEIYSFHGKRYSVRICYENGNAENGKKIYEMQKICQCEDCRNRVKWRNDIANCATVTTRDKEKIEEALHFLENWTCKNGKIHLKTEYIQF